MLEKQIQNKIIKYLSDKCYVIKTISTNKSGVPDIICCYQGKFIAFEVKTEKTKNNVSDLQKYNIEQIQNNKGLAFVISSLDEVKNIIENIKIY